MRKTLLTLAAAAFMAAACAPESAKIDVIFDTDADNELDDQHAIAYLLMNEDTFTTLAITTNVTLERGGIQGQVDEAQRVADLVNKTANILPGATAKFEDILPTVNEENYDGYEAVEFIIESAKKYSPENRLTVIAVGKLTNVALALAKAPGITPNIRLVWLGSNLPSFENEWNLICDIPSVKYVIDNTEVDLEIVPARYGEPSGTDAVRVSTEYVKTEFAGLGPKAKKPVTGRHGGEFEHFGDYSLSLFENIGNWGEGGTRALFDMVSVATVKNPEWATKTIIPAPALEGNTWVERPENPRKIAVWENFASDEIIADFIATLGK
ncbi:MAG: nucleoside hydrolase [Bacteroidales bacterium]|nr:nucleoside hydrolase [Bacteroidales bacterium]